MMSSKGMWYNVIVKVDSTILSKQFVHCPIDTEYLCFHASKSEVSRGGLRLGSSALKYLNTVWKVWPQDKTEES